MTPPGGIAREVSTAVRALVLVGMTLWIHKGVLVATVSARWVFCVHSSTAGLEVWIWACGLYLVFARTLWPTLSGICGVYRIRELQAQTASNFLAKERQGLMM